MTSDLRASGRARRVRAAALLAGTALAALPATAAADSIVFVEGGNVFSARPDGGGKVQLTDGGNWHSPTQSDDGTIAAVQGTGPIVVMARDGRPLHTITTQPAPVRRRRHLRPAPGAAVVLTGRLEARLRLRRRLLPGRLLLRDDPALDLLHARRRDRGDSHLCVGQPVQRQRSGVGHERADARLRRLRQPGLDRRPRPRRLLAETVDHARGRHGRRRGQPRRQTARDDLLLRQGDRPRPVRRQRRRAHADAAAGAVGRLPDLPGRRALRRSLLVADGSGLAYESSAGVETLRFTAFGPDLCETTGDSVVLAAGASEPDWGPADPPAARWTPPPVDRGGGRSGDGRTPGAGGGKRGGSPKATVKLAARPAVTVAALRRGLALKVRVSTAGKVTATFTLRRRTAAFGAATARRAGVVTVRLRRLPAGAARRLRGRRLTLTLRHGTARATAMFTVR